MEQILKMPDGRRVKLIFSIYSSTGLKPRFNCDINVCMPKKQTFINMINSDNYSWRRLSDIEKHEYKVSKRREILSDGDFSNCLEKYIAFITPALDDIF